MAQIDKFMYQVWLSGIIPHPISSTLFETWATVQGLRVKLSVLAWRYYSWRYDVIYLIVDFCQQTKCYMIPADPIKNVVVGVSLSHFAFFRQA